MLLLPSDAGGGPIKRQPRNDDENLVKPAIIDQFLKNKELQSINFL
jgi:hypothetical protein